MAELVSCSGCTLLLRRSDARCPHCGALRSHGALARAAGALAIGVALSGCPGDDEGDTAVSIGEPAYGVPATESATTPIPGTGSAGDDGAGSGSSSDTGSSSGSGGDDTGGSDETGGSGDSTAG